MRQNEGWTAIAVNLSSSFARLTTGGKKGGKKGGGKGKGRSDKLQARSTGSMCVFCYFRLRRRALKLVGWSCFVLVVEAVGLMVAEEVSGE